MHGNLLAASAFYLRAAESYDDITVSASPMLHAPPTSCIPTRPSSQSGTHHKGGEAEVCVMKWARLIPKSAGVRVIVSNGAYRCIAYRGVDGQAGVSGLRMPEL